MAVSQSADGADVASSSTATWTAATLSATTWSATTWSATNWSTSGGRAICATSRCATSGSAISGSATSRCATREYTRRNVSHLWTVQDTHTNEPHHVRIAVRIRSIACAAASSTDEHASIAGLGPRVAAVANGWALASCWHAAPVTTWWNLRKPRRVSIWSVQQSAAPRRRAGSDTERVATRTWAIADFLSFR